VISSHNRKKEIRGMQDDNGRRLQGDTEREATSHEVVDLKKENDQLKALVAELSLKNGC